MLFCMDVDPKIDEENPVLGPLTKLLTEKPELSEEWLTAKTWANLMQPYVPSLWTRNLGSGAIGRYFSRDRERLEAHLVMTRRMAGVSPLWKLSLRNAEVGSCITVEAAA